MLGTSAGSFRGAHALVARHPKIPGEQPEYTGDTEHDEEGAPPVTQQKMIRLAYLWRGR
jgi:hypothetical protein